ncbi:ATP-binding protein [Streptomyces ficellus]|nr:LuxR family transcriptional regulator [Streptomyces ficellus]
MDDVSRQGAAAGLRGCAFAGRAEELRTLLAAVSDARPAVVRIEGEAGIGKSRLVAEASAVWEARGLRVMTGACHPLREPLAYGPVIDALRRVKPWLPSTDRMGASAGALAPLLPDLAEALPAEPPQVPSGTGAPGAERFRVVSGVRTLLAAVGPAVLVVEDLHWADDATRELVFLLASDMPADTALVLTYRTEDLPDPGLVLGTAFRRPLGTGGADIALGPLGEAELRTMARDMLAEEPAPALVRALLRRSEGLPLVIEEDLITLARSRGASGDPAEAGGRTGGPGGARAGSPEAAAIDALGVPRSLSEVLAGRTGRLGPDASALVEAAAVLAVPAGETLLAETAGLDAERGGAALLEALRAAVLRQVGPDSYGFAHVLAQQAVYDGLPGPVRSRVHRRVLAVLEARDPPPLVQIAHHTRALGDRAAWLTRAQAAADHAAEVGDYGTAAVVLRAVLDQPDLTPDQLSRAARVMAEAASFGSEHTTTVAALRRILSLPRLPAPVRGEIRMCVAALLIYRAGDQAGEEELVTALSEVEGTNPALTARLLGYLGLSQSGRFSLAEQRAMVERGFRLSESGQDPLAQLMLYLADIVQRGIAADPALPELLAALPREGDVQTLQGAALLLSAGTGCAMGVGHDRRAAAILAELRYLGPRVHLPILDLYVDYHQLELDWLAGRWDEAQRGVATFRERHPDTRLDSGGMAATIRGLVAAARGRRAQAAAAFDRVLAREGLHVFSVAAAAGTARLHLGDGEPEAAWRALTDPHDFLAFLAAKEAWGYARDLVPVAVETLLALHRTGEAGALAERHAAETGTRDAPGAVAEQHLCRGLLLGAEDADGARDAFDRAAEAWRRMGRPYHAALAEERAAGTRTDPEDVAARLAAPLAAFDALGATSDAARCHSLLRRLGREHPNPHGRAGYGDRLSPRERQIRDLLASGARNKDIAAALFLSPRTVENHVARVLAKLHTTRADLARLPD